MHRHAEAISGKLASAIENRLGSSLQASLVSAVRDAVDQQLLPGLQAIMSDLVGQLSANISQAIVELPRDTTRS